MIQLGDDLIAHRLQYIHALDLASSAMEQDERRVGELLDAGRMTAQEAEPELARLALAHLASCSRLVRTLKCKENYATLGKQMFDWDAKRRPIPHRAGEIRAPQFYRSGDYGPITARGAV